VRAERAASDVLPGHPLARHIDGFLTNLANANRPRNTIRPSRNNGTVSGATWSSCRSQVRSQPTYSYVRYQVGREPGIGPTQLTCPNTDTDHTDQTLPVLSAPLFLEGRVCGGAGDFQGAGGLGDRGAVVDEAAGCGDLGWPGHFRAADVLLAGQHPAFGLAAPASMRGYIREGGLWRDNAAAKLGL
jgi:hypothetical protein